MGKKIADLIIQLLFTNSTMNVEFKPEDAYNVIKGILTGLKFPDVDSLMKCVNNIPDIYN